MNNMAAKKLPPELSGNVLVAGAGVSGAGSARMLTDLGVQVTIADDDETSRLRVSEATGAASCDTTEAHERLDMFSCVVTSPGWRPDTPLLVDSQRAGIPVVGDVELCWRLDRSGVFGPPRTWLAVTGTNGKTTTTAMLAAMMSCSAHRAEAVGNIGVAVGDALCLEPRVDVLAVELSSFQLHWSTSISPAAGCLLNLADDHIDWHGSFDDYAAAKTKALLGKVAVVAADDPRVQARVAQLREAGLLEHTKVVGFTLKHPQKGEVGVVNDIIVDRAFGEEVPICPVDNISPPGPAGQLDAVAAAAIARSQGVSTECIAQALEHFEVSGHRGQIVHRYGGVVYIDNSKATNPHAAATALAGHDSIIWVAGGQLKDAEITELIAEHGARMKAAVLLGQDRTLIADELARQWPKVKVFSIDETDPRAAMTAVVEQAVQLAVPGDAVVLAPAAASLDMFSGMGQRGDLFAQAVRHYAKENRKENLG